MASALPRQSVADSFMPSPISSSVGCTSISHFGVTFRTEFEMLLACCALGDRSSISQRREACVEAGVDWQQFVRLGEHHGVLPLIYRQLHDSDEPTSVPTSVREDLRRAYEQNARRNMLFTGELGRVLDCLSAHNISAIPYKGPMLAESLYGDVALREFSDLDILLQPADVRPARSALAELGYASSIRLSEAQERAYFASGYELSLDGPAGRNLLELQWGILPRFYAVDFVTNELFERSVTMVVGGRRVRALCAEDLLLTLCVHAAKHVWMRVCWLRDLAAVVASRSIDWSMVERRAAELGIERMVGVGFLLAADLLNAAIPDALRTTWQADRKMVSVCREIAQILPQAEDYNTESVAYFRLMFRLREGASDKMKFAWRLMVTPSLGEWELVRLPDSLFPLYRGVRLARVAARVLGVREGGGD